MDFREYIAQFGVFLLCCLEVIVAESESISRFKDKAFTSGLMIYGRNVTCNSDHHPSEVFPAQTWTCKDMRVDNMRMAYGYNPSFIAENHKCIETKGFDELGEVCRKMMDKIGSTKKLWVALVSNATCDYTSENRVMLNMTYSRKTRASGFQWEDMPAGYGWIYTLQCMAVK